MTVFKVVVEDNGKMYSTWTAYGDIGTFNELRLSYKIGSKTEAKVGKVFCFLSLRYAQNFRDAYVPNQSTSRLLVCKTRCKPEKLKRVARIVAFEMGCNFAERVKTFWKNNRSGFSYAPPGTYVVSSLTPIEVIE